LAGPCMPRPNTLELRESQVALHMNMGRLHALQTITRDGGASQHVR
jgi:hypothetical protein